MGVGRSSSFCGFVVKNPVGIPQIWWLYGQDPDWDTSGRVAYLDTASVMAFCGKIPFGSFSASWSGLGTSRYRLGYLKLSRSRLGYLKFCGFVVKIAIRISQVWWLHYQDFGGITQILWVHGNHSDGDAANFVAS